MHKLFKTFKTLKRPGLAATPVCTCQLPVKWKEMTRVIYTRGRRTQVRWPSDPTSYPPTGTGTYVRVTTYKAKDERGQRPGRRGKFQRPRKRVTLTLTARPPEFLVLRRANLARGHASAFSSSSTLPLHSPDPRRQNSTRGGVSPTPPFRGPVLETKSVDLFRGLFILLCTRVSFVSFPLHQYRRGIIIRQC